jgi:hypothetical protein
LVAGAAAKVWVELANPSVASVGLVLPTMASGRETTPEFAEFREALDTPQGLGKVELGSTRCGAAPGMHITLEPGQSVTRSLVFPSARREKAVATASTVRWRWREFNLERPYEEAQASACALVALGVEQGRCSVKAERPVRCPRGGTVDADLEQSAAEPPRK